MIILFIFANVSIPIVSIQFKAHVWFKAPIFDYWLMIIRKLIKLRKFLIIDYW